MIEMSREMGGAARVLMAIGAILAGAWVGLSAWSSHGPMALQVTPAWQSALSQHIVHALALLLLGLHLAWRPSRWALAAGVAIVLGLFLFCLTLEVKTWLGSSVPTPWVPWGGTCFLLGWLCWAVACVRPMSATTPMDGVRRA